MLFFTKCIPHMLIWLLYNSPGKLVEVLALTWGHLPYYIALSSQRWRFSSFTSPSTMLKGECCALPSLDSKFLPTRAHNKLIQHSFEHSIQTLLELRKISHSESGTEYCFKLYLATFNCSRASNLSKIIKMLKYKDFRFAESHSSSSLFIYLAASAYLFDKSTGILTST